MMITFEILKWYNDAEIENKINSKSHEEIIQAVNISGEGKDMAHVKS